MWRKSYQKYILDPKSLQCVSQCSKYDMSMQMNICEECPPKCEECVRLSDCKICRIGFVLNINTCSKSCPDWLHPNSADKSCKSYKSEEFYLIRDNKEFCFQCKSPCRRCSTDSLNWTSCTQGKFWNGHDCFERCDEGTFPVQEYGMCLKCYFSCKTCGGQFSTDCLFCAESLFLFQGKCLQ
jgi:proprotein convertase subtilisin/kexin type 5